MGGVKVYRALFPFCGIGAGFMGSLRDKTPRGRTRGGEIAAWLETANAAAYAILDDEPEPETHAGRWVAIRYAEGLTAREANEAIRLLGVRRG